MKIEPTCFNVCDFGAVGDGVADDTAAVQAALNAATDLDAEGIVLIPPDTRCRLTDTSEK